MTARNMPDGSSRRIAMVAYTHYSTDPRCRREAELARAAGWEVEFYALRSGAERRLRELAGVHLIELPVDRYRGESTAAYLLSYLRFLFRAAWAVARAHERRRYDVVHVDTMPDFMVLAALWPRLRGAKVILDMHDVMPEIYMSKFGLPATHPRIRLIKAQELASARLAHHVLAATHTEAELLVAHGLPAAKLSVLLNLPDEALFARRRAIPDDLPQRPEDEFRLIYHGTIAPRLGLDLGIRAVGLLRERFPGLRFDIIGEGDQLPELHALVDSLDLTGAVRFSDGFRPIEDILPTLVRAHCALLPSRQDASTDIMLPTKLLEYLALGVPALVSTSGTIRHYFGEESPLQLQEITPERIAERIAWVREHWQEAERETRRLQESFFARYTWSSHGASYLALIESLAAGGAVQSFR